MGAQQDLCEIGGVCGFDALAQMKAVEWRWVWKRRWSASMGWGKWGEKTTVQERHPGLQDTPRAHREVLWK